MRSIINENGINIVIGVLCLFFVINYIRSNMKTSINNTDNTTTINASTKENFEISPADYPGDRAGINKPCSTCDNIIEPSYLNRDAQLDESGIYAQEIIDRQSNQIRNLRNRVKGLVEKLDDTGNQFYRRKLSNKYYKPQPFLAYSGVNLSMMNLDDDDFSNKTLSTIKFLSQTRSSKYFGDEVHFPTELCGNFCSTSDPNRIYNSQVDSIRPISK